MEKSKNFRNKGHTVVWLEDMPVWLTMFNSKYRTHSCVPARESARVGIWNRVTRSCCRSCDKLCVHSKLGHTAMSPGRVTYCGRMVDSTLQILNDTRLCGVTMFGTQSCDSRCLKSCALKCITHVPSLTLQFNYQIKPKQISIIHQSNLHLNSLCTNIVIFLFYHSFIPIMPNSNNHPISFSKQHLKLCT